MNGDDLDFFVKELWEPSLSLVDRLDLNARNLISNLYPVELSVWLQFGGDIGVFDRLLVKAILEDNAEVLELCRAALPEELRKQIIYENLVPRIVVATVSVYRWNSMFRHHMLMTSELMSDRGVIAFLEILIAFQSDLWASVIYADKMWLGSLEDLCGGFSRILAHLESAPVVHTRSEDEYMLNRILCEFQTARLGLGSASGVGRYFEFAGAVLAQYELPSDKIDTERAIFREMYGTLAGWPRIGNRGILNLEECWHAFVGKRSDFHPNARMRFRSLP
jgi:hypothetical protein